MNKRISIKDPEYGRIAYVVNRQNRVLLRARPRTSCSGFTIREYAPPVTLEEAISHDRNYSNRYHASVYATQKKIKELTGGLKVGKTAKVVKTKGPYGSIRFRDVKTGLFVAKR